MPLAGVIQLDLSFTQITDKAIAALAEHPKLSTLNFIGTKVTDAAIDDLRQIPDLRSINLAQTKITSKGLAQLVQGKWCTVCPVARGDQARFRVFQEFENGKLQYTYLMINDTYYGRFYPD